MTQVQKLELEWPPYIGNFFAMLNVMSLSLSRLSPRCVVEDWRYLDKLPYINAMPPLALVLLVSYQYLAPRLRHRAIVLMLKLRHASAAANADDGKDSDTAEQSALVREAALKCKSMRECAVIVMPAMLIILSWMYVVLANANMEFFNCVYVESSNTWHLAVEPSVICYDFSTQNQHRQLLPLCCIALLVYVVGIPALFGTLLFGNSKVILPSSWRISQYAFNAAVLCCSQQDPRNLMGLLMEFVAAYFAPFFLGLAPS